MLPIFKQSFLLAMYLSVCVLGIFGVSAQLIPIPDICYILSLAVPNASVSKFKYVHSLYRRSNDCNICYGGDCLALDQARCEYYTEADSVLQKDDEDPEGFLDPRLQNNVDNLIYDIVEKVDQFSDMECIPYISRYTDCTKENVCLGCRTCHCVEEGRWNCSSARHCHTHYPALDVDHRILVMTIENLITKVNQYREKRSVTTNPFEKINDSTLTLEELSEFIYGIAPEHKHKPNDGQSNTERSNNEELNIGQANPVVHINIVANNEKSDVEATPQINEMPDVKNDYIRSTTEAAIKPHSTYNNSATIAVAPNTITTDSDYLAFDEVLSNIAIDSKNYSRRKPLLEILPIADFYNKTNDFDYMLLDDDKTTNVVTTGNVSEISYIVNFGQGNDGTERPVDEATKVVIDLLESAKKDTVFNSTDYIDMSPNKEDLVGVGFDNTNDIYEYNPANIMKREISSVTEAPKTTNITYETDIKTINVTDVENKTVNNDSKNNLKNNVLLPLIKLINSKRNELEDLKKIKENLISFMNYYNQSPIVEIIDYPNISDTNILHDFEMFPDLGYDLRRTNTNVRKKFLYKLKSDIYEVIKDIIALQRYKEGRIPDDLSLLIHSLKRYVFKTKSHKRHLKTKNKPFLNYRRHLSLTKYKCLESTFKQCIVEIFQTIDKDMPKNNALGSLSPPVRRILRNIIRTYSNEEYASIEFRIHDPNYNMKNELHTIGTDWQDMSHNAIGNSPHETMYKMKLLHYFLERDINKINDALTLIQFTQNRRITSNFQSVNKDVLEQVNKGLNSVQNKVEIIVHYHGQNLKTTTNNLTEDIGYRLRADDDTKLTTPAETKVLDKHQHKKVSFIKHIRNLLTSSKKDIGELLHRQVPKSEIVKQLAKKKLNEIAQKRYEEYENAMKKWQRNLGIGPRYRRNVPNQLPDRIKNIIPKYLRRKVHPSMHEKKNSTHKSSKKEKKKHGGHKKNKKTTLTTATTPRTKTTKKARTTKKPYKSTVTTPKIKTAKKGK